MKTVIKTALLAFTWFGLVCCNKGPEGPEDQLTYEIGVIDANLAEKGISAYTHVSGLRFTIENLGTGLPPNYAQAVQVQYVGKFLDGSVFDQGTASGLLSQFIVGWRIGIPLLPKGTKATLYIPSEYGYGTNGSPGIPPNATLQFEVELLDVVVSDQQNTQLLIDIGKIDDYLTSKGISAIQDTTGLRYVVATPGAGATATWYDRVEVSYVGKLMENELPFGSGVSAQSVDFDSRVVDYIQGLQIGLQKMKPGAKMTFYVPSGLAYGPEGSANGAIPGNANLIFEIELVEISN